MRCAIWYHLYNLRNVKNTHGGVLISVKLQAETCNFTKINTPPWVLFTFLKLYKWYQIAQRITYSEAKTIFLEGGRSFFLYIVFPFQSYYMESTCTAVYMSAHKCTMREENICLKVLVIEVQITILSRFPVTVDWFLCYIY